MAGIGLAGGYGAGAAADAAAQRQRDVLEATLAEQRLAQLAREAERQAAMDAEGRRRWEREQSTRDRTQASLEDARAAQAAKDRADAEARVARQKGLQDLAADPTKLANMTPVQRALALQEFGVNNLSFHDVIETPDEHARHVRAEGEAKWSERRRELDYTEQQRRSRPRANARLVADDPTLPLGTQRYLSEIARKHGENFEAAQGELSVYLNDPQTIRDHPRLSPVKALTALRQAMSAPTGRGSRSGSDVTGLVDQILTSASAPRPSGPSPTDALLQERARAALRQRLGRDATDAEVQTVLSNPKNRQLLAGGGS